MVRHAALPKPPPRFHNHVPCTAASSLVIAMAFMPSLCWPEVLEINRAQVIAAARQFGVRDAADLESEEGEQMRRQLHLVGMMSPGDPPIYVHNNQRGGPPQGVAQMAHHEVMPVLGATARAVRPVAPLTIRPTEPRSFAASVVHRRPLSSSARPATSDG